ncbi:MAG TPA: DUF4153 domain-containing protein [Devosia sp.]|nr:DUF4153 domain-containing protein [Devosia sp.]
MAVAASFDGAAFRRFPLAIAMQTVATVLVVGVVNGWLADLGDADWMRAIAGLSTGALFALAGNLFLESRPERRAEGIVLAYVVPLVVAGAFQVHDTANFAPTLLPAVGMLWASVAAFTGQPAERIELQNRFWWLNHRAFATLLLALAGLALLALGCLVIQQSVAALFDIELDDVFWKGILPIAAFLLAPVYWLSTLPRLSDYDPKDLFEPDFITKAVGFLGQFVLAPILIVYAAILLVYAGQIALARALPHGMLGWMVLGFTVAGAATWLLLYPPFMADRLVVRLFRRSWFWLTVVPLVLLAIAITVRVLAYGLSTDRMLLIGGGLWAATLTVLFLFRRGDIRQIPAVAATILALLSVGPWNIENGPRVDQARRLDATLAEATDQTHPTWSADELATARSAVEALIGTPAGRNALAEVLAAHDIPYDGTSGDTAKLVASFPGAALAAAATPGASIGPSTTTHLQRPADLPIDITQTPLYLGPLAVWRGGAAPAGGLSFTLQDGNKLEVANADGQKTTIDLGRWGADRTAGGFNPASVDFDLGDRHYRLIADGLDLFGPNAGPQSVTYVTGVLFSGPLKPPRPAPGQKAAPSRATP